MLAQKSSDNIIENRSNFNALSLNIKEFPKNTDNKIHINSKEVHVEIVEKIKDEVISPKKENRLKKLINYLDKIDKDISRPLHRYSPGLKIECIFYAFARLYNVDTVIYYLISILFYSLLKHKSLYMVLIPLYHILFGVLFTVVLKKVISRPRPVLQTKRYFVLKESSHSMPSGDSLQAGLFSSMIIMYFNNPYKYCSLFLIPGVMAGRVFYNLHYWFDCIIGAILGISIFIFSFYILNYFI